MAIFGKPTNHHPTASPTSIDVGQLFVRRFYVVSIYVMILLILAAAIVWTGIKTAESVQQYHQDYKTLQDMKKQERKLQIERQRLLIEQQTFSATPQIASRAVAELGMYSPTLKDKLIIQPGAAEAVPMVPETAVIQEEADEPETIGDTDVTVEDSSAEGN